MDHVLYLYGSGMGNPNLHDHTNLPILVAGGAAGNMQGGRHLQFEQATPLANLHITLLDKVGVHQESFADSDGKVNELFAAAAERNDADAVRRLLRNGGDVNRPQRDGMTALHWATHHENEELVELLIKTGAQVKAVTRYGVSPLSIACQNGSGPVVERLLDAGADPQTTLPGGETARM